MNCYRCGEEREHAGYICQPCLDEVMIEEEGKQTVITTPLTDSLVGVCAICGKELFKTQELSRRVSDYVLCHSACFTKRYKVREITERQKEVLGFIEEYIQRHQYSPAVRGIAEHFKISPKATLDHIRAIEKKGFIKTVSKRPRIIIVLKRGNA